MLPVTVQDVLTSPVNESHTGEEYVSFYPALHHAGHCRVSGIAPGGRATRGRFEGFGGLPAACCVRRGGPRSLSGLTDWRARRFVSGEGSARARRCWAAASWRRVASGGPELRARSIDRLLSFRVAVVTGDCGSVRAWWGWRARPMLPTHPSARARLCYAGSTW